MSRLGRTPLSKGARHAHTPPSGHHCRPAHRAPRSHARGPAATAGAASAGRPLASSIAVDWTRTAVRTIFVERASAPPLGALYLSFTSLAVHDAAREGQRHGTHAAAAAVAQAAHDVLLEYFPLSASGLDADLAASLARVPDGAQGGRRCRHRRRRRGRDDRVPRGRRTLRPPVRLHEDRRHSGRGRRQPFPAGWRFPWLGFVDPVVDVAPVALDGPDPRHQHRLRHRTTRRPGWSGRTTRVDRRTPEQTATAEFFAANPIVIVPQRVV